MEVRFRLVVPGEPSGTIDLSRLESFAKTFRAATLRSAQAALSIPSFRHRLGEEPRPEYRLVGLTDGSTTLVLAGEDERPITREAVTRHLVATEQYDKTGTWPAYMYPGELQAWAAVYETLFRRARNAEAIVSIDGTERRITQSSIDALAKESARPMYREVIVVGNLHMIDVGDRPRFQIGNEDADLVFELGDAPVESIDPFRWKRVRAHALWEAGTRRGRLQEPLVLSEEPMGIQVLRELDAPDWVVNSLGRIESYANLRPGWNGPGSRRVPAGRAEAAQELVRHLYERFPDKILPQAIPSFIPNSAGNIEFDWEFEERFLNVELIEGGYEILAATGSTDLYEGQASQQEVFAWIEWLLTGELPPRLAA